jgi:hypothetical protein
MMTSKIAEKMLARFKGLRERLQAEEEPLFTIPAIWDGGRQERSKACDVILTNQRIMGFIFVRFPRERLFLEALPLKTITTVSLRQKTHEPLFRELLVSDGQNRVYIRAPRWKIEALYTALRDAIEQYAPAGQAISDEGSEHEPMLSPPAYGRQEIRTSFDRSPLAVTMLFTGGIVLEIGSMVMLSITHSLQTSLPIFIAGLVAVCTSMLVQRQRRSRK